MTDMQTNQTPEELAEEILCLSANGMDWTEELMRLRDMAARGAKDAERWRWVRAENSWDPDGRWFAYPNPVKLDEAIDAAIATTKRGRA